MIDHGAHQAELLAEFVAAQAQLVRAELAVASADSSSGALRAVLSTVGKLLEDVRDRHSWAYTSLKLELDDDLCHAGNLLAAARHAEERLR